MSNLETIHRMMVRNTAQQEVIFGLRKKLWSLQDAAHEHQGTGIGQFADMLDAELNRLADEGIDLSTAWNLEYDRQFGHAPRARLAVVK